MRYKSITIKDGLSENHVNSIVQDKAGNMWFGTWFGLNKYDGLNLIPYYNVHIKERIHPLISCKELLVDKTGNIWCVFEGKVLIINNHLNTKQIAEFFPSAQNIHITESNSDAMYFWYSGNNKLIAYNRSSRDTTVHIMPFRIKDVLYHENKFYFATNKGMFTQKEKELGNPKKIKKLLPEAEKLNLQNEKTLWISTSTGVVLFNPEKQERIDRKFGKTNHLKLKDMFNGPVCFDNQNRIWGKTLQNRLVNFHTTNQTWDTIDFINKDVNQNYSTKINDLLVDDFSILWIATSEGVKYLDLNQNPINNYIHFNKEMAGGDCKAIEIENEKKLWVLHENGLSTYSADNANINNLIFRTDHLLPNEWNAPMVKYRKGIYLIGAYGLDIYDSNSGSFYYINPDSTAQGLPDWMIYDIHKGQKSGEIWIGSNGFSRLASLELPLQNKKQEGIHKGNATFETLIKDIRVYTIYEDAEGYLWLATVVGKEGLKRYNPKTKELVNVGDKYFNNNYTVSCIYEYPKGVLWLGTEGGGLFKLTGDLTGRPRNIHIEQIEKKDGLCSNFIQSLIADNSGKLWIATINGLSCLEPSTKQITIFDKHSSFVSVRFNRNAVCKKDGEIFLGSSNGIVSFIPEKMKSNPIPPKISISELYVDQTLALPGKEINGRIILEKPLFEQNKIRLTNRNNDFSIKCMAVHHANPEGIKIAYKLEEADQTNSEWKYTDVHNKRFHYEKLQAGSYEFRIKAANQNNVWSEETVLQIEILPPFWATWWFRVMLFISVVGIIFFIYRTRTKVLRRQREILAREVNERTQEVTIKNEELETQADNLKELNALLTDRQEEIEQQADELMVSNNTKDKLFGIIAHDLRNPFQSIISLSDSLISEFKKIKDEKRLEFICRINETSKKTNELLENLLQWSQYQMKHIEINPQVVEIFDLAEKTKYTLDSLAKSKSITLINDVEKNIQAFVDENMLFAVIRNIVHNAIKYTPVGGYVKMMSANDNEKVEINIIDTGQGIPEEIRTNILKGLGNDSTTGTNGEKGIGFGLTICQEFIKQNNGFLDVFSEKGSGTCFTVFLPARKNAKIDKPLLNEPHINLKTKANTSESSNSEKNNPVINSQQQSKKSNLPVILIVEDNFDIRFNIKNILTEEYTVLEAENGKEGLKIATKILPDLILSDIIMPEMNGISLGKAIKQNEMTSHIPFILLTAKMGQSSKKAAFEAGADAYLSKPFNQEELKLRIQNLLNSRKSLKEKYTQVIKLEPFEIEIENKDEVFFRKIREIIERNLSNPDFNIARLCEEMNLSRYQFYRKFKTISEQKPVDFIIAYRMKRAVDLLKDKDIRIKEVMAMTGFNSASSFIKNFKKIYGVSPSDYLDNLFHE